MNERSWTFGSPKEMKVRRKGGASAPPPSAPDGEGALAPETRRLQGLKAPNFTRPQGGGAEAPPFRRTFKRAKPVPY